MDYHYKDLDEATSTPPQSNAVLAGQIAELTRLNSALERDLRLMKADRDRLIDELAKRWPNEQRIDAIGTNGNTGEHYELKGSAPLLVLNRAEPVRYMVGAAIFRTKGGAIGCHKICLSSGVECDIIPLYAGEPLEVKE